MDKNTGHLPLFNKRAQYIIDAMNFKEPEKVPVGLDYLQWPYVGSEKLLADIVGDPEENAKNYCRVLEKIPMDYTMNSGGYEPYDAIAALGSEGYALHSDGFTVQQNQANHDFIDDQDYEVLISDYDYFVNEYYPKKVVPAFKLPKQEAYERLKVAARCAANNVKTSELIAKKVIFDYQIVPLALAGPPDVTVHTSSESDSSLEKKLVNYNAPSPFYYASLDSLFDNYRGMMGVFEDLMENIDTLDRAVNAITESLMKHMPPMPAYDGHILPTGFTVFHSASYLDPEQFEKYWFKDFKQMFLPLAEQGARIFLKGEGSFMHLIERFKELPRGSVIIQLDQDDPFEAKKVIGNDQVICGGMQTALLMIKDEKLCKERIKRCFEELAPGGGYLFYQDMPLLSPGDADPSFIEEMWYFANECSERK